MLTRELGSRKVQMTAASSKVPPEVVYSSALEDAFWRSLSKAPVFDLATAQAILFPDLHRLSEALVVSPRVVLDIGGKSRMIPTLVDYFGYDTFLELVDTRALEFMPRTCGVGSLGSVVLGMPAPSADERDIQIFADRDLEALSSLAPAKRANLVRSVGNGAIEMEQIDAENAVLVASQFADLGAFGKRIPDSSAFHRAKSPAITAHAKHVAEDLHRSFIILKNEYGFYETDGTWDAMARVGTEISRGMRITKSLEKVCKEVRVPSIKKMLECGLIAPSEIAKIRAKRETKEFRRWLWSLNDPAQSDEVAQAFLAAIRAPMDDRVYKKERVVVTTGFSTIAAALGGLAGPVVGAIAGAAVSIAEPFFPDYFKKPDPLLFTDRVLRAYSKRQS